MNLCLNKSTYIYDISQDDMVLSQDDKLGTHETPDQIAKNTGISR